jgi:Rrf2 family protein
MLRMSKLADYGTVIMTAIALDPDTVHSARSGAAETGLPMPTVSKVLKVLLRGKLVVSVRGVSGGYLLSRPPEQITLADVITGVDGPIGMAQCSTTPGVVRPGNRVRHPRELADAQSRDL